MNRVGLAVLVGIASAINVSGVFAQSVAGKTLQLDNDGGTVYYGPGGAYAYTYTDGHTYRGTWTQSGKTICTTTVRGSRCDEVDLKNRTLTNAHGTVFKF